MQDNPDSRDQITTHIGDNASRVIVGHIEAENVYVQAVPALAEPPTDWAEVEARYRSQVVKHYNKLALTGLPERAPGLHEISLEKIFVKLNITLAPPIERDIFKLEERLRLEEELLLLSKRDDIDVNKHLEQKLRIVEGLYHFLSISVAEALERYRYLVVTGGPGSGKTTLTRWLSVISARREQAESVNLGSNFLLYSVQNQKPSFCVPKSGRAIYKKLGFSN